jgi:hypothetical protein
MGQTAGRSYEEQQRQPGDYEVQVSQRPIAVHALEHRVTSDRGVSKLRKILRDHVRAHSETGEAPMPKLNQQQQVATYCQDTVYPVTVLDEEQDLMRRFGRRVSDKVLESDSSAHGERAGIIESMCKSEFE